MVMNYSLLEVMATTKESVDYKQIESELKKKLNTCRLAQYKSTDCLEFYDAFFLNSVETDPPLAFQDWAIIYNDLISMVTFGNSLCFFMAMYRPSGYTGLFRGLRLALKEEMPTPKSRDEKKIKFAVRKCSDILASARLIYRLFDSICITIKNQINDQQTLQFCSIIERTLNEMVTSIEANLQGLIATGANPDSVVVVRRPTLEPTYANVSEAVSREIDDLFSVYDPFFKSLQENVMNEGIVNTAKEKANVAAVKLKKMSDDIDRGLMTKWKKFREGQRNRKHAEIVGEAFRFTNEIRRILLVAPAAIINPALPIILWVASVAFDRHTDKEDRKKLIDDLKDELEIVEDKIQTAERKGDDKERVQLIRIRQKLVRELERISKVSYQKRA